MAIPGILPQQVDAQLQGQVPLPQGIPPQQVAPQQVQQAPQQLPVQPAPAPQQAPQQVQQQAPEQAESPGIFGIPNSQLAKVFEKTKDPNARLQAATFLGSTVPAPTDEEIDILIAAVEKGGV